MIQAGDGGIASQRGSSYTSLSNDYPRSSGEYQGWMGTITGIDADGAGGEEMRGVGCEFQGRDPCQVSRMGSITLVEKEEEIEEMRAPKPEGLGVFKLWSLG